MRKALVGAECSMVWLYSRERDAGREKQRRGRRGKVEGEEREVTYRNYYLD